LEFLPEGLTGLNGEPLDGGYAQSAVVVVRFKRPSGRTTRLSRSRLGKATGVPRGIDDPQGPNRPGAGGLARRSTGRGSWGLSFEPRRIIPQGSHPASAAGGQAAVPASQPAARRRHPRTRQACQHCLRERHQPDRLFSGEASADQECPKPPEQQQQPGPARRIHHPNRQQAVGRLPGLGADTHSGRAQRHTRSSWVPKRRKSCRPDPMRMRPDSKELPRASGGGSHGSFEA
jgi:hypothetical protein